MLANRSRERQLVGGDRAAGRRRARSAWVWTMPFGSSGRTRGVDDVGGRRRRSTSAGAAGEPSASGSTTAGADAGRGDVVEPASRLRWRRSPRCRRRRCTSASVVGQERTNRPAPSRRRAGAMAWTATNESTDFGSGSPHGRRVARRKSASTRRRATLRGRDSSFQVRRTLPSVTASPPGFRSKHRRRGAVSGRPARWASHRSPHLDYRGQSVMSAPRFRPHIDPHSPPTDTPSTRRPIVRRTRDRPNELLGDPAGAARGHGRTRLPLLPRADRPVDRRARRDTRCSSSTPSSARSTTVIRSTTPSPARRRGVADGQPPSVLRERPHRRQLPRRDRCAGGHRGPRGAAGRRGTSRSTCVGPVSSGRVRAAVSTATART